MNGGYAVELRDLEYFAVVAEQANLGRAAELLGLSQPALSKSIARLEDAMEVKLFRRSAKGMELTAEGSLLLQRARELRQSLRNVAREISDVSRGHAGHIRVGLGPSVNDQFVLAAFAELLREEPRITMKVIVSDADETMPLLHSGQLDVVINILHPAPPAGLVYVPLYQDEQVVCCASSHRLAGRSHVPLVELGRERWALSESGLPAQQRLHDVFRANGLEPPRVAFESRSIELRIEATARSDLLLYTSRARAGRSALRQIVLHPLPVKELCWLRPIGVIHRKEPYLPPAVRRLIEILVRVTAGARPGTADTLAANRGIDTKRGRHARKRQRAPRSGI
jgi:DNA-binding transcriptional LysR family regulator